MASCWVDRDTDEVIDTSAPHWLGSADGRVVELLILFDPQGMRTHIHAGA